MELSKKARKLLQQDPTKQDPDAFYLLNRYAQLPNYQKSVLMTASDRACGWADAIKDGNAETIAHYEAVENFNEVTERIVTNDTADLLEQWDYTKEEFNDLRVALAVVKRVNTTRNERIEREREENLFPRLRSIKSDADQLPAEKKAEFVKQLRRFTDAAEAGLTPNGCVSYSLSTSDLPPQVFAKELRKGTLAE